MKQLPFYVGFFFLLVSCARLPVVESRDYSQNQNQYRFYDAENRIWYDVQNDEKHVYLSMSSPDPNTQMKMLGAGLHLYFDPSGKKRKKYELFFPQKTVRPQRTLEELLAMKREERRARPGSLTERIENINPEAVFINFEGNRIFNVWDDNNEIRISLHEGSDKELIYKLAIPLALMARDVPGPGDLITIGLQTDAPETRQRIEGRPASTMPGGRTGGSRRPGGGSRSRSDYPAGHRGDIDQRLEPVKLWFQFTLAESRP